MSTRPLQRAGDATSPEVAPHYRVFISYSHADTTWAKWLIRKLEGYRVSRRFHGRSAPIGEVGLRLAPVFRDRDELPTTSDLSEIIREALRESATLVVICSPASAQSRWVQQEIVEFKRVHGEDRVFAFIVAGEPKFAGTAADCFSPALRAQLGPDGELSAQPAELVAADARLEGDGPKLAFVRLVAGLLGVGFDELRQRELQRRNRRLTLIAAGATVGMVITLGLSLAAWRARNEAVLARNDAQRRQEGAEDVLAFMLGDFRTELKKVGRLDLLDKVGDKAMTYFDGLDARDITDTALARQAKALTQIGEIRIEQQDARYADAGRAFFTAYQRAAALTARHPQNTDMLFERAQAEYWIGFVHWKRRDLAPARDWLTRYRDSAAAMVRIGGPSLRAQRELISGHHNLAVLDLEAGRLDQARDGFRAELAMIGQLLASNPADHQITFRISDVVSWLASVAEQAGQLPEAVSHRADQVAQLAALVDKDPKTAHWRFKLADAKSAYAILLAATGQPRPASEHRAEARSLVNALLAADPKNRRWQILSLGLQLDEAAQTLAESAPLPTAAAVETLRRAIEKLLAAEPKDRASARRLAFAWRTEAAVRHHRREADAVAAAQRAIEINESLLRTEATTELFGACAQSCVTAAQIAAANGRLADARRLCDRVLDLAAPHLETTRDWRLLEPVARAFALQGRAEDHRRIADRLASLGHQPLAPWPSPLLSEN